jgi:Asp/Glu/hydantoin racemase
MGPVDADDRQHAAAGPVPRAARRGRVRSGGVPSWGVTAVGFLHTADVHVETFRRLLGELAPGWRDVHVVDAALLASARDRGVDEAVEARLHARLSELAAAGPRVIVCTCSTLSGHAERMSPRLPVPVLRIDRPMAEQAVALGRRIAVVAAVASTLAPTRELLRESASAAGVDVALVDAPCLDAWALFEAGRLDEYARRVAAHARQVAADADVIVLAQASMAPAAALLRDLDTPVLTSPQAAVARAVAMAR